MPPPSSWALSILPRLFLSESRAASEKSLRPLTSIAWAGIHLNTNVRPAFGFTYKHQLPADCLRLLGVYDSDEPVQNYTSSTIVHKVEGRSVLTDEDTLNMFYIKRVTDEAQFDPTFNEAFSYALAIDLGYILTAGADRLGRLEQSFNRVIRAAKLADAIEGTPQVMYSSDWLDARTYGTAVGGFRPGPIANW